MIYNFIVYLHDTTVGVPGRFHIWDQNGANWKYIAKWNPRKNCELSMVLPSASFCHKYYAYAYTELMPQAIRDKVDEFMNCEDLAMNFLICHLTRLPPVKFTLKWNMSPCRNCTAALSKDGSHYRERDTCVNFFAEVYGYMPLLNTQYRADSL